MRRATTFILGGVLILGLAVGAMAFGGYGMMGGGWGGGWGGHMMPAGYHMGYQNGYTPGSTGGPGQASTYCPGFQGYNTGRATTPGTGSVPNYQGGTVLPGGPTGNLQR